VECVSSRYKQKSVVGGSGESGNCCMNCGEFLVLYAGVMMLYTGVYMYT